MPLNTVVQSDTTFLAVEEALQGFRVPKLAKKPKHKTAHRMIFGEKRWRKIKKRGRAGKRVI